MHWPRSANFDGNPDLEPNVDSDAVVKQCDALLHLLMCF